MNVKVYYVSSKGCAEKIAEAIARECRCVKEALMPAYPPENVAMMFIGCEGAKPDKVTMDFLNSLNTNRVHTAALFSCNSRKETTAIDEMRAVLEAKGIRVLKGSMVFPCKGFLSGKMPGPADEEAARNYARECLSSVG